MAEGGLNPQGEVEGMLDLPSAFPTRSCQRCKEEDIECTDLDPLLDNHRCCECQAVDAICIFLNQGTDPPKADVYTAVSPLGSVRLLSSPSLKSSVTAIAELGSRAVCEAEDQALREARRAVREAGQAVREAGQFVREARRAVQEIDDIMQEGENEVMGEADQAVREIDRAVRELQRAMREAGRAVCEAERTVQERREYDTMTDFEESRSEDDESAEVVRESSTDAYIDESSSGMIELSRTCSSEDLNVIDTDTDDSESNGDEAARDVSEVTDSEQEELKLPPPKSGEKRSRSPPSSLEPDSEVENDRSKVMVATGMSSLEPRRKTSEGFLARHSS